MRQKIIDAIMAHGRRIPAGVLWCGGAEKPGAALHSLP